MENCTEKYYVGVEREALRCNEEGSLSDLPHPRIFGNPAQNALISTDFGDKQMELKTTVCKSTEECYSKLENITNVVLGELKKDNEYLWPYSMPCNFVPGKSFAFKKTEMEYQKSLISKYGEEMLYMSGIHINFSIKHNFFEYIKNNFKGIPNSLDEAYLKITRNFLKKTWMLIYILGATPYKLNEETKFEFSYRNSKQFGFNNKKLKDIDFNTVEKYINSVKENIKIGYLSSCRELYLPIRIKGKEKNELESVLTNGINYIEVRLCDINPFDKCGISIDQLNFVIAFLFNCLIEDEDKLTDEKIDYRDVAQNGISDNQYKLVISEIENILINSKKLNLGFDKSINDLLNNIKNKNHLSNQVQNLIKESDLLSEMIKKAKEYSNEAENSKYSISGYSELSVSTVAIIKDALLKGIDYNILNDRKFDTIVELINTKTNQKEFVIGGTRTRKDSYIFPYITDDKFIAKKIMRENEIKVPDGDLINNKMSLDKKEEIISQFYNKSVVVKPRNTNSGTGITVFKTPANPKQLKKSIKYAFEFDNDVLLEEYIAGNEYRFLVIDNKCVSVVHRRCSSVVGDGKKNIQELVDEKNKEVWHYLFKNPVVLDEPALNHLEEQELSLEFIPKLGERIFLRNNSNCSKGGEGIDVTKIMPIYFKKKAENISKIFKCKICGVDIIIDDLNQKEYHVIEINDDPGIDLNEWPYEGEGIHVGFYILELLKLI